MVLHIFPSHLLLNIPASHLFAFPQFFIYIRQPLLQHLYPMFFMQPANFKMAGSPKDAFISSDVRDRQNITERDSHLSAAVNQPKKPDHILRINWRQLCLAHVLPRMVDIPHFMDLAADISRDGFQSTSNLMTVIPSFDDNEESLFSVVDGSNCQRHYISLIRMVSCRWTTQYTGMCSTRISIQIFSVNAILLSFLIWPLL